MSIWFWIFVMATGYLLSIIAGTVVWLVSEDARPKWLFGKKRTYEVDQMDMENYHEEIARCRELVFPSGGVGDQRMFTKEELEELLIKTYSIWRYAPGYVVNDMYKRLHDCLHVLYAWECYYEEKEAEIDV